RNASAAETAVELASICQNAANAEGQSLRIVTINSVVVGNLHFSWQDPGRFAHVARKHIAIVREVEGQLACRSDPARQVIGLCRQANVDQSYVGADFVEGNL